MKPVRLTKSGLIIAILGISVSIAAARDPQYEVTALTNVMVPMRDGVKLATDIYFPTRNGTPLSERFPVIFTRTPYNKTGDKTSGEYFAARGYTFVTQDTRGRY